MSPTARTLLHLRKLGYIADVVERWIPKTMIRKDLFGAFDVVAVKAGETGVLGIQCTTEANFASRWKKLQANPAVQTWRSARNRVELWTVAKRRSTGARPTWVVRRTPLL